MHKHIHIGKIDLILSTGKRPRFFRYKKIGPFRMFDFWFIRILWNLPRSTRYWK